MQEIATISRMLSPYMSNIDDGNSIAIQITYYHGYKEIRYLTQEGLDILDKIIKEDIGEIIDIHNKSIIYAKENPECACVKHSRIATCEECSGTGIRQPSQAGIPVLVYERIK